MTSLLTVLVLSIFVSMYSINQASCGRRSSKWDDYIRTKRQAQTNWQDTRDFPVCTLGNTTQYDALGRRNSGLLATPEHQGRCGSCWAFAITHAIADQRSISTTTNNGASFSVDHLTRCHTGAQNGNGCCGSSLPSALNFLKNTGTASASCLPYTLSKNIKLRYSNNALTCPQKCADKTSVIFSQFGGYNCIQSEDEVMAALERGPVIAAVKVNEEGMMNLCSYRCGVYSGPTQDVFSHAIEIVDYSSPSYTPQFWVVKNSWGNEWGEGGYFRIERGSGLLDIFFSLNADESSTVTPNNPSNPSPTVCGAQKLPNVNQNMLVESAAEFGLEVINNRSLIKCGRNVPTLQLLSIHNASQQVVEGLLLVITVEARVMGCGTNTTTATIEIVVMMEMDNSFTFLDFSHHLNGVAVTKACSYVVMFVSLLSMLWVI